ncbi:MAG: hypothetical protein RLY86_144 [Pseudomonadota bacterium]
MPRRSTRAPLRPATITITKRGQGPDPIDMHVGSRIRLRRTLLGLSLDVLSGSLGLTYQQLQKYERGANRISASRLFQLAQSLDVPVGFFFDGVAPDSPQGEEQPLLSRQVLSMVRVYQVLPDEVRQRLYELAKSIAQQQD